MSTPMLNLNLTIDETNILLEGLGHVPFARAFELVNKIQNTAKEQLEPRQPSVHVLEEEAPVEDAVETKAARAL